MTLPSLKVYAGFGSTWLSDPAEIVWTDLTSRVMDRRQPVSMIRGATSVHGKPDTGQANLTFRNSDRMLDPLYTAGTYYGDLVPGVPVKIEAQFTTGTAQDLFWDVDQLLWDVEDLEWGASTSTPLWWGSVKSWPQRYDRGNRTATVPVTAYDGFDKLSRAKIPRSVLEAEILSLSPTGYWSLGGATQDVPDRIGSNDGTVIDEPEATQSDLPGIGPGLIFDGINDRVDLGNQFAVPDPGECAIVAVFSTDGPADASSIHPIFFQGDGNYPNGNMLIVAVDTSGRVIARFVQPPALTAGRSTTAAFDDGQPHIVIAQADYPTGSTIGIAVDSATLETAYTVIAAQGGSGSAIGGTPRADANHDDNFFPGTIWTVAVWDTPALDVTARQALVDAMDALDGQTTDERIGWILDELGWPSALRDFEPGASGLGPASFKPGDAALEYLRLCADTEDGLLYITADGKVRLLDRYWRYLNTLATTSQITFTDSGGVGVAQFEVEPADDELLVNVARYTRREGTEQVAVDETSRTAYGEAEEQKGDLLHRTDAETRGQAQWAVATKSLPTPRVPKVTVNLGKLSAANQAIVLGLDLGHRVTCTRTPQATGTAFSIDCVVAGVRHEVAAKEWRVEFYLAPAPDATVDLFVLGTSELGSAHILAY